jgi:hypothetical protein
VLPPTLAGPSAGRSAVAGAAARGGALIAVVGRDDLWLLNRGDRAVYSHVEDRARLALADWYPCTDPARCPPIAPGAERAIRIGGSSGLAHGRDAVVYWWHAVATTEGTRAGAIRSLVVSL